eukprot:scaffold77257_cov23-Tisochrysis_lutea.AAC.2
MFVALACTDLSVCESSQIRLYQTAGRGELSTYLHTSDAHASMRAHALTGTHAHMPACACTQKLTHTYTQDLDLKVTEPGGGQEFLGNGAANGDHYNTNERVRLHCNC